MATTQENNLASNPTDVHIIRLLHLIEGVNQSIENSKKMNSDLMVRQYEHLKRQYAKELMDLLSTYQLPIRLAEAA